MAVTIKDVAKKAGVAHGTVSRFLNGYQLSSKNKEKVEAAITELDYKVNFMARALKNNSTYTVGVLVRSLVDFFETSTITYIQEILENKGYSTIVCDYCNNTSTLKRKLEFMLDRSVDGVIVFAHSNSGEILKNFQQNNIPVVLVDEAVPGVELDTICVDNLQASFIATQRLIDLNHKKIGIIANFGDSKVAQDRLYGYMDALHCNNLPIVNSYLADGKFTIKDGYDTTKKLLTLPDPPTAIFITNYYMAMGAVSAILEMNLRIPEDISIISFDYFEQYDNASIPLTCIVQPISEIGKMASTILLKRMEGNYSDYPLHQILPTTLLQRKSQQEV